MAKSCTRLTSFNAFEPGAPVVSPSVSPAANSLIVVRVFTYENTSCSISGLGLSWTTGLNGVDVADGAKIWVFYAFGSPSSGTITVTPDGGAWLECSVDNVTGTVDSSAPVTNIAYGSGTSNTMLATLPAFASVNNGTLGIGLVGDDRTITQGSGFSLITTGKGTQLFSFSDITEFQDSNDTSVDATFDAVAALWWMVALEIKDSVGGSSVTKTPTTANLSLGGQAVLTNAFTAIRIRDVLINKSGQPIGAQTNLRVMVWYGGLCRGAPDVSLNAQTCDSGGTASWSIPTGTLVNGTPIFYVAQDSLSFSNYTAARMIPSYE